MSYEMWETLASFRNQGKCGLKRQKCMLHERSNDHEDIFLMWYSCSMISSDN